jgi:hypothetical protein
MSVPSTPAISVDTTYIGSPRLQSPDSRSSSRRVSLDVPGQQSLAANSPKPRRNRSALRQFYGLQQDAVAEEGPEKKTEPAEEKLGEIDREGFEAVAYVEKLVSTAELKELLRKENELVNGNYPCASTLLLAIKLTRANSQYKKSAGLMANVRRWYTTTIASSSPQPTRSGR